jgi:uncharacterized membrane protein YesL
MYQKFINASFGNVNNPSKHASIVILSVTVFWLVVQLLGLTFFFDFTAISGFLWALLVLAKAFQKNNRNGDN